MKLKITAIAATLVFLALCALGGMGWPRPSSAVEGTAVEEPSSKDPFRLPCDQALGHARKVKEQLVTYGCLNPDGSIAKAEMQYCSAGPRLFKLNGWIGPEGGEMFWGKQGNGATTIEQMLDILCTGR